MGTPILKSANPDAAQTFQPTNTPPYAHPAERRRGAIPMAFQITSPFDRTLALLPDALVLHVNPASFNEAHVKKVERIQTRGGFVEQHWGDDLDEITCDGTTGAFVNLYTGLSSVLRQQSIAWSRYRDLHDLFYNNGSVKNPAGAIVLQGNVMLLYDRGTYIGYFRTFEVEETEDSPFAFKLNWSFKVQETILKIPNLYGRTYEVAGVSRGGVINTGLVPDFQAQNRQTRMPSGIALGDQAVTGTRARPTG